MRRNYEIIYEVANVDKFGREYTTIKTETLFTDDLCKDLTILNWNIIKIQRID